MTTFETERRLNVINKQSGLKLEIVDNPKHFKRFFLYDNSDEEFGPVNITGYDTEKEMNEFVLGLWYFTLRQKEKGPN